MAHFKKFKLCTSQSRPELMPPTVSPHHGNIASLVGRKNLLQKFCNPGPNTHKAIMMVI